MSTISIQSPAFVRAAGVAVGSQRSRTARGTRLRLTVRGRRVLAAIVAAPLVVGIVLSVLAGGTALASARLSEPVPFQTVSVLPGDSLWSIAGEIAPEVDPRVVIDDIVRLNNLSSGAIQAGAELAIPARYSR
ncbi:LysM peptidoglycan-binding domain-containing protein [Microbacterium soli]|uniref:LysM domain-containing protein n=1 Tax=Microbacterium soli TaxID=446075 RepID=A0ABP7NDB5_9MICO